MSTQQLISKFESDIAEYSKTHSIKETAKVFGVGYRRISRIRGEFGIAPMPAGKSQITQEEKDHVISLRKTGMTFKEIGKSVGVSTNYAWRIAKHVEVNGKEEARLTSEELGWAQELRNGGMTIAETAETMEVPVWYIEKNTEKPKNRISATKFRELAESGCLPDYEISITVARQVIGTFTPAKSAH